MSKVLKAGDWSVRGHLNGTHFRENQNNANVSHDGSMGRLYIYLHGWLIFMVLVGKYTSSSHGSFGYGKSEVFPRNTTLFGLIILK